MEEAEAQFAAYAAGNSELSARNITDFDLFEAFYEVCYSDDKAYQDAKERGDIDLRDHVLYSGETNYFTILELRRFLDAWDGEDLPSPEEAGSWGETQRLDEKCRERVRVMREDRVGRSVLPYHIGVSTSEYTRYLAVWCIASVILLLSPTLVRDRLHRMQPTQWASRKGRRILNTQFAAVLFSGSLLTVLNIALYSIPFAFTKVLAFRNCSLHSVLRQYPWFSWTYGQYLLAVAGLILLLSLSASALTAVLSQYSGNYVAMLLKAIPLIAVLAVLGMLVMTEAFFFSNLISRFLALPGSEIYCAVLLASLGLGLVIAACCRQRQREFVG